MEVNLPTQATTTTPAAGLSEESDKINSDFEVFLKMLTAQMQYQDPLNPVDSTDYATQLATFSGVEQAVLTNELLQSLTTQMNTGGLVDMAALVGKEVRFAGPVYFDGQPLTLLPTATVASETAELVVRNEAGDEVQRLPIASGADQLEWAGVGQSGAPMPAGVYQFEVVAKSNDEVIGQTPVETYSAVNEVRLEGGNTVLLLSGGVSVPTDQVSALRAGSR